MKTFITSILFTVITLATALAQKTVDAKEIIDQINQKKSVSYQNAIITGDLDLTSLANRKEVKEGNWNESGNYLSVVDVPLSFNNCTFKGKFLAYWSSNQDKRIFKQINTVYNTDFTEAVTIENCKFEDDATFKYSHFSQRAIFANNTFEQVALFKYSKFRNAAEFSGTTFHGYADFKYTEFDESSAFKNASFDRYADFKYTKFDEGADFSKASFSGNTDFKYTKFPRGTSFDEARFSGFTDFKYTTLNGRKFSPTSR